VNDKNRLPTPDKEITMPTRCGMQCPKIDEYTDENVSKTKMVDGNFDEQYVYEMKQKRGPSLMTCVIQEPKNLEE
jgi:hypothetical protein